MLIKEAMTHIPETVGFRVVVVCKVRLITEGGSLQETGGPRLEKSFQVSEKRVYSETNRNEIIRGNLMN